MEYCSYSRIKGEIQWSTTRIPTLTEDVVKWSTTLTRSDSKCGAMMIGGLTLCDSGLFT